MNEKKRKWACRKVCTCQICGEERPPRDVLCQLSLGHEGRHRAVIFWE